MSVDTEIIGESSVASPKPIAVDRTAATTPDGCPNPLGWADVLEAYRSQSSAWSIHIKGEDFTGRTLGTGRPLYLLSGLSGNSDLFCLMAWLLRDEFRCLLFDYPTHAKQRRGRITLDSLVAGLFAAADRHGDSTFSVFATSFGGTLALTAMATHPARIDRAILQAAFAYRRLSSTERILVRLGRFFPGTLAGVPLVESIQRANHQRYFPPFDRSRWGFFRDNAGRTAIRDAAARAAIVSAFDVRPRLADIRQPVLLIRSEHEGQVSAACTEQLQSGLPNATIEMLHTTGPLAHLAHPHRLAKLARTFLAGSSQSGAPDASVCVNEAR